MEDFITAERTLSLDDFKALEVLKPLTEDEEMEAIQNAYAQAAACSILFGNEDAKTREAYRVYAWRLGYDQRAWGFIGVHPESPAASSTVGERT